jgi:rhodanese-related sulfurtransferase
VAGIPELQPAEFAANWPNEATLLLDVREPVELTMATVQGAVHIPMGQVADRLNELDNRKTIVVMCHGGMRSMMIAQLLKGSGFDQVFNLAGGIDAWSRQVDASVPRY